MQSPCRSLRDRARYLIVLVFALVGAASTGRPAAADPEDWTRVQISDSITRAAVQWSLEGADRLLMRARCQTLFSEFQDREGRPLAAVLAALRVSPREYLHLVTFVDGSSEAPCYRDRALAFTQPRGRVVRVCGRDFERAWRADKAFGQAVLVHEMLHSLGLDENPPSSRFITTRVHCLCDRP